MVVVAASSNSQSFVKHASTTTTGRRPWEGVGGGGNEERGGPSLKEQEKFVCVCFLTRSHCTIPPALASEEALGWEAGRPPLRRCPFPEMEKQNGCTRTDPPTIALESRSPAPAAAVARAARSTAAADTARRTRAPRRPRSLPGESDAAGAALETGGGRARGGDRGAGPGSRDHWRRHQPSVLRRGWTKRAHRPQPSNALKREHFGSLSLVT